MAVSHEGVAEGAVLYLLSGRATVREHAAREEARVLDKQMATKVELAEQTSSYHYWDHTHNIQQRLDAHVGTEGHLEKTTVLVHVKC